MKRHPLLVPIQDKCNIQHSPLCLMLVHLIPHLLLHLCIWSSFLLGFWNFWVATLALMAHMTHDMTCTSLLHVHDSHQCFFSHHLFSNPLLLSVSLCYIQHFFSILLHTFYLILVRCQVSESHVRTDRILWYTFFLWESGSLLFMTSLCPRVMGSYLPQAKSLLILVPN